MLIKKYIEDNKMTIQLEGKLDANTVPELENEISDLSGIKSIVFDFQRIEYISSFGLRFILKCKKQVDDTRVINCIPDVYEIFTITGFSEMMKVEKQFREISIDNCEKIGEGFFGNIYRIDSETVVKVFKVPDAIDLIKREKELARKAFVMGIPTAIAYDIVKVGDLYGAVFELLNAKPLATLISSEEEIDEFAKKSAEILKNMHQKKMDDDEIPSRKESVIDILKECENLLEKNIFDKLRTLIESIPDTNTLLHCDFHIKNIMMQNDELLLIDMDKLSVGHPIFEFASMYATYKAFACVDKHNTDKFLGMPLEKTTELFYKTFEYYYNDKSEDELKDIELKISIISYLQVLFLRAKFASLSYGMEKEEIDYCVKYLTENSQKLDSLCY